MTSTNQTAQAVIRHRLAILGVLLFCLLLAGTVGYRIVSRGASTWVDCLYMTVITLTTIGYGEVVDMAQSPGGRIFTMLIAFSGIGLLTYVLTNMTALVVDHDFREERRKRAMEKMSDAMQGHYIICGCNATAMLIARELLATGRKAVLVGEGAIARDSLSAAMPRIEGDTMDDSSLERAGISRAAGLFAVTGDDHKNVVLCLSARQANAGLRIVAASEDTGMVEKMRKVGADAVISALDIGALRMASEMIRPAAVSFLDIMLRAREHTLRVEEIELSGSWTGRTVAELPIDGLPQTLLLALKNGKDWIFKPSPGIKLDACLTLVVMTTPDERALLQKKLKA